MAPTPHGSGANLAPTNAYRGRIMQISAIYYGNACCYYKSNLYKRSLHLVFLVSRMCVKALKSLALCTTRILTGMVFICTSLQPLGVQNLLWTFLMISHLYRRRQEQYGNPDRFQNLDKILKGGGDLQLNNLPV